MKSFSHGGRTILDGINLDTLYNADASSLWNEISFFFFAMRQQGRQIKPIPLHNDINDNMIKMWLNGVLQNYYGIMILFVLRATLKATRKLLSGDFRIRGEWTKLDVTFSQGWNCDLYLPAKYELRSQEASFGNCLRALKGRESTKRIEALQHHCRTAAELLPVSQDAPVLAHIRHFFDLFYPKE